MWIVKRAKPATSNPLLDNWDWLLKRRTRVIVVKSTEVFVFCLTWYEEFGFKTQPPLLLLVLYDILYSAWNMHNTGGHSTTSWLPHAVAKALAFPVGFLWTPTLCLHEIYFELGLRSHPLAFQWYPQSWVNIQNVGEGAWLPPCFCGSCHRFAHDASGH